MPSISLKELCGSLTQAGCLRCRLGVVRTHEQRTTVNRPQGTNSVTYSTVKTQKLSSLAFAALTVALILCTILESYSSLTLIKTGA